MIKSPGLIINDIRKLIENHPTFAYSYFENSPDWKVIDLPFSYDYNDLERTKYQVERLAETVEDRWSLSNNHDNIFYKFESESDYLKALLILI